jgi:hypothetical protein
MNHTHYSACVPNLVSMSLFSFSKGRKVLKLCNTTLCNFWTYGKQRISTKGVITYEETYAHKLFSSSNIIKECAIHILVLWNETKR